MKAEGPLPGNPFLMVGPPDEEATGYLREEWIVSGEAQRYTPVGALEEDGRWEVSRGGTAAFRTRLVVCRPRDPARFDGSVFVEWMNVSGGIDACPDYLFLHRHWMREGTAWVGVSAQKAGIAGGGLVPGMPLQQADPGRYGSLVHPGDAFAFDLFGQVAELLRTPGSGPLGALAPERILAVGESQSAGFLVSYVNAVDPVEPRFDAFLVHGRPGAAAGLDGTYLRAAPDGEPANAPRDALRGSGHRIREDVRVPVLTLQSETDVTVLGGGRSRQPDGERFRLWELAGAAHFDTYGLLAAHGDREGIPVEELAAQLAPRRELLGMKAERLVNSGPQQHYVLNAAASHLTRWVREGVAPPEAPRLEGGDAPGSKLRRDELGIARGGIRTPWVDAPSAVLSGQPPGGDGFTFLFGRTVPFEAAALERLYPGGPEEHARRFETATAAAVEAGFLLEADAPEIRALARHGLQPSGWRMP